MWIRYGELVTGDRGAGSTAPTQAWAAGRIGTPGCARPALRGGMQVAVLTQAKTGYPSNGLTGQTAATSSLTGDPS